MKRLFTLLIVMEYSVFCFAQTVTLKFTGRDANGQYCPLNQVTINNLSQNWQETLNWPDTTLILNNEVGVSDYGTRSGLNLSQNIPNPFTGTTEVRLDVADNEDISITGLQQCMAHPQAMLIPVAYREFAPRAGICRAMRNGLS